MKDDPNGYHAQRVVAAVYMKMKKFDYALKIFGPEYIKDFQDDAFKLNSYAWFWALEGKNLDSALEASKKSTELEPQTYYYWDTLGMVYWKLKKYEQAVKAQEKAVELNPADPECKERLEQIKAEMKNK